MSKDKAPREFWIALDEGNKEPWPAYETNRAPSVGNKNKFIHVISFDAYQQMKERAEVRLCEVESLKKINSTSRLVARELEKTIRKLQLRCEKLRSALTFIRDRTEYYVKVNPDGSEIQTSKDVADEALKDDESEG